MASTYVVESFRFLGLISDRRSAATVNTLQARLHDAWRRKPSRVVVREISAGGSTDRTWELLSRSEVEDVVHQAANS